MFWQQFDIIKDEMIEFEDFLLTTLESNQRLIQDSISELAQAGGKRVRPALVIATAHFGEYERERVWKVAAAVEMLHMATLIHDDIIDESNLRRGKETIQSKHGKDIAVFTGDYLFSLTFNVLSGKATTEQLKEVADIIQKICEGEIQQYQNRYQADVSYKDYFRLIKRKTALLFEGSCMLGAGMADLNKLEVRRLGHFGRYLGMAFQLTDDILDFTQAEEKLGKLNTNDFTQGIYTLPILYVLYETDKDSELKELLQSPIKNQAAIKKIVSNNGGLDYTLQIAEDYISKAKSKLSKFADNPYQNLLANLADRVINRDF